MPNELEYGGEIICLGIGSAYRLKKHLFEDYQKSYDELMIVNVNLPPKSIKVFFGRTDNDAWSDTDKSLLFLIDLEWRYKYNEENDEAYNM